MTLPSLRFEERERAKMPTEEQCEKLYAETFTAPVGEEDFRALAT